MFYQSLAAMIVAFSSLLGFLQSFRSNPTSSIKHILVIVSLVSVDFLNTVGWLRVFRVFMPISLLVVATIVLIWAFIVAYARRKLILFCQDDPTQEKFFFRKTSLTHARMFPERYNYGINYFLVGTPVGLRARVGALMTIDSDRSDQQSPATYFQNFTQQLFRKFAWFGIDTSQYLHRGDGHMSLTQKLEIFLKERGEDISNYPYAYLIGIPQFCWWTKSPISYWYLYSSSKELSAIIMEINNSYGEKKNAFCRLIREENFCFEKKKTSQIISTALGTGDAGIQAVRFVSSAPNAKYYKGSWDKDIFASPFEKVEGWFNLRFMDPLDPSPEKGGPLHSNMTLMSIEGKPKVSSRLFSCSPPFDPLSASSWGLTKFLLSWSFVIPASIGRIVVEALRIRFRGNMLYLNKPDVKKNNIPRKASKPERVLETFFRMYLSSMVNQCQIPLEVVYTPAKSLGLQPISMHSPVKTLTLAPPPVLMIQPLTPKFYTNILKYPDAQSGFAAELESDPQISDPISQRIWISDLVLLQRLIGPKLMTNTRREYSPSASYFSWPNNLGCGSFMDDFTDDQCSKTMRKTYRVAKIQCYLTEKFAWGSYRIAGFYWLILCAIFMRLVWKGLWSVQCNWAMGRFPDVFMVSSICLLLLQAFRGLDINIY
ncbi:hypothetical protein N7509_008249 [Penicillium cosmopolitanum]|uniref:Uncharacterized protein n=1 Tax=Penicillium cosmopolitanum TaxID=1131564 RepID=A0A9W9VM90_9EURO|nr:uncharacterized protein N7509_008249 [Penicillium cosmopolitanum]KAJ5385708.1 hypothetical protein N7509_008249 [Penicillium cosmopolitanum]